VNIIIASGWALLLGNLVFQAAKSMISGMGFESDDPRELFLRTFVFGFLLLASRQICEIGLGLSSAVIDLLQAPSSVSITLPEENAFAVGASWLLVIIIGFVLMWQLVKLFLDIGERYFLFGLLTVLAPWAFAMGGSKSTADIFKGWARMFATMCFMMVMNVVILKLLISAMGHMPSGPECMPWVILVVAIARVGRKLDNMVMRIGLNPTAAGGGGRGLPGMLSYMIMRNVVSNVMRSVGGSAKTTDSAGRRPQSPSYSTDAKPSGAGSRRRGGATERSGFRAQSDRRSAAQSAATSGNRFSQSTANNAAYSPQTSSTAQSGSAGTPQSTSNNRSNTTSQDTGTQHIAQVNAHGDLPRPGNAGIQPIGGVKPAANPSISANGTAGTIQNTSRGSAAVSAQNSSRATTSINQRASQNTYARPGIAGTQPMAGTKSPVMPAAVNGSAGTAPAESASPRPSRFTAVPPVQRNARAKRESPGKSGSTANTRIQQGGASISAASQTGINAAQSSARQETYSSVNNMASGTENLHTAQSSGIAGKERRTSAAPIAAPVAAPPPTAKNARPGVPDNRAYSPQGVPQPPRNPAERLRGGEEARRSERAVVPRETSARLRAVRADDGNVGTAPPSPPRAPTRSAAPYKPRQPDVGKGAARVGGIGSVTRGASNRNRKKRRKRGKK
jgi:hypothetical protein